MSLSMLMSLLLALLRIRKGVRPAIFAAVVTTGVVGYVFTRTGYDDVVIPFDAPPPPPPDTPPPDSPPDSPPPSLSGLVAIMGQSNAVGQGVAADVDPSWSVPFTDVHLKTKTANNTADPPTFTTYDGDLAPHPKFGAELSYGREIPAQDIAICAVGGANLAVNWDPNGTWPSTGGNLYTQCVAFLNALEVSSGRTLETILWFQGESDAATEAYANAYYDNLVEIAGLLMTEFPCARFLYYRLKTPGTYVATVRAAQDAFAATGTPFVTMVNVSTLPTLGQHFTSDGYLQLGEVFAAQVAALAPRCP